MRTPDCNRPSFRHGARGCRLGQKAEAHAEDQAGSYHHEQAVKELRGLNEKTGVATVIRRVAAKAKTDIFGTPLILDANAQPGLEWP